MERYVIPAHKKSNLEIFTQISHAEGAGRGVSGEMRSRARRALTELTLVPVPTPPPGLPAKDRKKVERLARRAVKTMGIRGRAKDYPVPEWVKRSRKRTEYYRARITFEVGIRKGYKEHEHDIA